MITQRITRAATTVAFLGLLATATACNDEVILGNGEPVNPLVASWDATGFTADGGADLVAAGLSFRVKFGSDSRYRFTVKSDLNGVICEEGQTACIIDGPFTSTAKTITINSGTVSATIFNYTIVDATMTWSGTAGDGAATSIVFARVS